MNVEPDGLATRFGSAAVRSFHDSRSTAGGNHETMPRLIDGLRPLGHEEGQLARVLVVTRHLDFGPGAADALLLLLGSEGCRAWPVPQLEGFFRLRAAMKARRAKEHNRVLDAFAAKARQDRKSVG